MSSSAVRDAPRRGARAADRTHAGAAVQASSSALARRRARLRRASPPSTSTSSSACAPTHPGSFRLHGAAPVRHVGERRPRADPFPRRRAPPIWTPSARATRRRSRRAGGIDLQILGTRRQRAHRLQRAGDRRSCARTHRVTLRPATRRRTRRCSAATSTRVPREALSMGMATILQARRIVLIATGDAKARVRRADGRGAAHDACCRRRSCSCTARVEVMLDRAGGARSERPSRPRRRAASCEPLVSSASQPRLDVLADRLAHRVVRLAQPRQRLRVATARSSASRSRP